MNLNVHIHKIKSIDDLVIGLPTESGLYAITGQNGSGKSTIAACASRAFFHLSMNDYFGVTAQDSFIECELNGIKRMWYKQDEQWLHKSNGLMEINGFYEGSLIFGNRFRNTSYEKLKRAESVKDKILLPADDFIRKNLGEILQGDPDFYEKMWYTKGEIVGLRGGFVFYYEKNGKRISQFHMSTGENLLISVLNSIFLRNNGRDHTQRPCMLFLDEIELALHPSSLVRLIHFMENVSTEFNYAVYFSTHSIELVSGIKPTNIFYIERHSDNSMEIINPCYPAYATKFLYDQNGYDNVILVEDDLAKEIVVRILKEKHLLNSKLVHVLPCGGWTNVLRLADDSLRNYLLGKRTSLAVVLDKDIEPRVKKFVIDNKLIKNIPINYLPIESLEKFLRNNLVIQVDHQLYRILSDYLFQQRNLPDIIREYQTKLEYHWEKDENGKTFYSLLQNEINNRGKDRKEMVEIVVDYLLHQKQEKIEVLIEFLHKQLTV